jgi:hypothetical protein
MLGMTNKTSMTRAWRLAKESSFVTDTRTTVRLLGGTAHARAEGDGDNLRFWITVSWTRAMQNAGGEIRAADPATDKNWSLIGRADEVIE